MDEDKLRAAEGANYDAQNGFMFEFSEASRHRHGRFRPDEYSQSEQIRSKNSAHLWRNLERAVFAAGQLSLQSKQAPRDRSSRSRRLETERNSQPEQSHHGKRADIWRNLKHLVFAAGKLSLDSKCSTRDAKQSDAKTQDQSCDAQTRSSDCKSVTSEMECHLNAPMTTCVPSAKDSSKLAEDSPSKCGGRQDGSIYNLQSLPISPAPARKESQAQVGGRELGRGHVARQEPNGNMLSLAGVSVVNSPHGSSLSVDDRIRFGLEDNCIVHCHTNKSRVLDESYGGRLPCGSVQPISMARTLAQLEGAGFGSSLSPLRKSERQLWRLKVQ